MEPKYAQYLLQKTRDDYNLIAEEFSASRYAIWPELHFFDKYVENGDKVLDLGCGNGRLVELFRGKNVEYIGVDNSERLIEMANNKLSMTNYRLPITPKFLVADAFDLPFPDNYFDKIFSIAVLHHIPSKEYRSRFLKEAGRVLKPGGFLILTCWKFHEPRELFLLFKFTVLKLVGQSRLDFGDIFEPWGKKIERYYHDFSKKELANLEKIAGLKIENTGVIKNTKGNRQNIYLVARK